MSNDFLRWIKFLSLLRRRRGERGRAVKHAWAGRLIGGNMENVFTVCLNFFPFLCLRPAVGDNIGFCLTAGIESPRDYCYITLVLITTTTNYPVKDLLTTS